MHIIHLHDWSNIKNNSPPAQKGDIENVGLKAALIMKNCSVKGFLITWLAPVMQLIQPSYAAHSRCGPMLQ